MREGETEGVRESEGCRMVGCIVVGRGKVLCKAAASREGTPPQKETGREKNRREEMLQLTKLETAKEFPQA
jgi:hypothetical protein